MLDKKPRRVIIKEVPESGELPDHLVHVMRVMGRMEHEEAQRFATEAVTPTLERMHGSVKDPENPFKHLIAALSAYLVAELGAPKWRCQEGSWGPQDAAAVAQGSEE